MLVRSAQAYNYSQKVGRVPAKGTIIKTNSFLSLTNSRGSRVQCRGRGSNVAAGENDLGFEVTAE